MNSYTITLTDTKDRRRRKHIKIKIPGSWSECSLTDYIKLEAWRASDKARDLVQLFCLFADLDYQVISQSRDSSAVKKILFGLQWINVNPPQLDLLPVPEQLKINGKVIQVPKDLADLTISQHMLATQLITDQLATGPDADAIRVMPAVLAIYLGPQIYGDTYDYDKALATEPLISKLPVLKIYPVARFFFQITADCLKPGLIDLVLTLAPRLRAVSLKLKLHAPSSWNPSQTLRSWTH